MRIATIFLGAAFVVVGPLYYKFVMAWSNSDKQVRRLTEQRWGIGRHIDKRARRGEVNREEWVEESIPRVRKEMRGWQRPISIFLAAFGIFLIVQAFVN